MFSVFLVSSVFHLISGTSSFAYGGVGNTRITPHDNIPPTCDQAIFCDSELLKDVSLSGLNKEWKIPYLRKKALHDPDKIVEGYRQTLKQQYGDSVPKDQLRAFVEKNFADVPELTEWVPDDFKPETALMGRVKAPEYKEFLVKLQDIWKILFRKVTSDVAQNEDRYSIIYLPNGFAVAGGHFQELYYWDTYWIINGLLLSDMSATVKGIIENFLGLVRRFGFIPNGTRVYYLNRSQPPLLIHMADSYLQATNDWDFIEKNLPVLTSEFEWWPKNREVTFEKDQKIYRMFRYAAVSSGPRPESFEADYELAKDESEDVKQRLYSDLKSGAESGWDFSSRWFIDENGNNNGTLKDIRTRGVLPVELNSILQKNAALLSKWWFKAGNKEKGEYYKKVAETLLNSIHEVFWRDDFGTWFDWDLLNSKHRKMFFPSNVSPLWTGSYHQPHDYVANRTIDYLKRVKILCDDGVPRFLGIPTTLEPSGQQWDFPNGWSPLQMFVIQGLARTGNPEAQKVAEKIAQNWVYTNYLGLKEHKVMYEKYDVTRAGHTGGGGEYKPQAGFGWTNGAAIILCNEYADILSPSKAKTC